MQTIVYLTQNEIKFNVAARVFQDGPFTLLRKDLETPEIQSESVADVALYSARWASQALGQAVAVTDAGFYIEALNGFPGPFVKYVTHWLGVEGYLRLMAGQTNRHIVIRDCLAYCCPGDEPLTFHSEYHGQMATCAGKAGGTPMDQIFIPAGYDVPISEIPPDEMIDYWSRATCWQQLKDYLYDNNETSLDRNSPYPKIEKEHTK